jgi:hypothetical protein
MALPDVGIAPWDHGNGRSLPERVTPWCFFYVGLEISRMQEKHLMSLGEATKHLPTSNGKSISTQSLWRWCSKGVNGHRLRHYRFGKRIAVTLDDLLEFGELIAREHIQDKSVSVLTQPPASVSVKRNGNRRTPEEREKAVQSAEKYLIDTGLLKETVKNDTVDGLALDSVAAMAMSGEG